MIPRPKTHPPTDDPARQRFCDYLRTHREAKGKKLDEIAHETRIPERSLRRLEDGRFEELPGDVFVRGFLRSYARCVELDPEEAIRRYAACGLEPAPVSSREAAKLRAQASDAAGEGEGEGGAAGDSSEASAARPDAAGSSAVAGADTTAAEADDGSSRRRHRTFLPPELFPRGDDSRRGHLTLAVIILVIVATLAMSYLMRRPSDAGDGVTLRTPIAEGARTA